MKLLKNNIGETNYEYKEQKFTGVIVGFVDLVIVGYLEVIYQDVIGVGVGVIPEKLYIQKVSKEIAKCSIVYYANNKKHYVPIDKINKLFTDISFCDIISL